MSPETLFRIQLVLGYVAWLLCFGAYIWPRLKSIVSGVVSTPCKARPELQHANHQERMGSHIWLTI